METATPRAFRPATAATYTGHSRSAIYEAIRTGQLKSYKIDGRRLLLREDLDDWINRLIAGATGPLDAA